MIKIPHERFCILPWVSVETTPIGTVRPCCLADEEIRQDNGELFSLSSADLGQVSNSKYMKDLRQQFLDGKQPQTCRKCWNEERAGRTSKRMHTLERLKHIVTDEDWSIDAKPLMFLDLKLGNICNLKCRICGSWSSSTFAVEEIQFSPRQDRKENFHYTMLRAGAWPQENQTFWQEIDRIIDGVRYIEFTGGEPFMIREHFQLLKAIRDRGLAHQVEIHYNTNGTQWPEEAEEIWKHFKTVEIAFSIDDTNERFEYQRTNAVWQEVQENIKKFQQLQQRHNNIQLQCCSTVNVFNVMYLDQLAEWIALQGFDFVYWNMMQDPYYFGIASMPSTAKDQAIKKLQGTAPNTQTQQEFDRIIDFIRNGVSLDGHILRLKVRDLDNKRNQDLRRHHYELAEAIDYHRFV